MLALSTANAVAALLIAISMTVLVAQLNLDFSSFKRLIDETTPVVAQHQGASGTPHLLLLLGTALLLGFLLRRSRSSQIRMIQKCSDQIATLTQLVLKTLTVVLSLITSLLPVAVFFCVAQAVGTQGFRIFESLGFFAAIIALGLLAQVFAYYSILIRVLTKRSPLQYFQMIGPTLLTAFSAASSLATIPVTLRTLKSLKVSDESSRLVACVGTNLNHDGILLYEAAATLFIAHVLGFHLSLLQKLMVCATSIAGAIGIAGVPEAGLITLTIVLGSVGLPANAAIAILPVDWFLGRMRASVNVASDITVATVLG